MHIYCNFTDFEIGTPRLFDKLERMLVKEMKGNKSDIEIDPLIDFINRLGIRKCVNDKLWNPALNHFEKLLDFGGVNHVKIYYVMRALASVNLLDD